MTRFGLLSGQSLTDGLGQGLPAPRLGDQQPTPTPRLLEVPAQLTLGELLQVRRQGAPAPAAVREPTRLRWRAPEVRVHLSAEWDAQLMVMAIRTEDLGADTVPSARRGLVGGHHFARRL